MHSVLLIDEILRNIFNLCLYHDRHRHTLVSASRSCKSWKDPALDLVWARLTSFKPLLLLLPGILVIDGEYVCLNFCPIDKFNLIYSDPFPNYIPWRLSCIQVVRATRQTCQLPTRIQSSSHHIQDFWPLSNSQRKCSPEPCKRTHILSQMQRVFLATPYIIQSSDPRLRLGVQSWRFLDWFPVMSLSWTSRCILSSTSAN